MQPNYEFSMRKDLVSASGLPFYSQKYNYELGDTFIIFRLGMNIFNFRTAFEWASKLPRN